jgi:hypothetical protein
MSTGEPDARKAGTSGSEGGRRKRTSTTGTSSAAYPTSRRDLREPEGETPSGHSTTRTPLTTYNRGMSGRPTLTCYTSGADATGDRALDELLHPTLGSSRDRGPPETLVDLELGKSYLAVSARP